MRVATLLAWAAVTSLGEVMIAALLLCLIYRPTSPRFHFPQ
jgi:threonine/homoserine efflux transporter RhtA